MTTDTLGPAQAREAWDAIANDFDRRATPHTLAFAERALSRVELGRGVRVLDVASGSGGLSVPAARRGADVLALDISPTMVDLLRARARVQGLSTLQAEVADCQTLAFDDGVFDVVVSMNGVSLFPDIPGGLREMVRVTRRGGQVLVVVFGPLPQAEFIALPLAAMQATAPGAAPPPGGPPMPPFRLSDPAVLQRSLQDAGLSGIRVDTVAWTMAVDSAEHLLELLLASNPIARQLTARLSDEQLRQVRQVLDGMLRERSGGAPGAVLTCQMHVGTGTA